MESTTLKPNKWGFTTLYSQPLVGLPSLATQADTSTKTSNSDGASSPSDLMNSPRKTNHDVLQEIVEQHLRIFSSKENLTPERTAAAADSFIANYMSAPGAPAPSFWRRDAKPQEPEPPMDEAKVIELTMRFLRSCKQPLSAEGKAILAQGNTTKAKDL